MLSVRRETVVRILLLAALLATAWKGLARTPEIASVFFPEQFYNGLVNDAENSFIMKERHYDFNEAETLAAQAKLEELLRSGNAPAPDSLVTEESLRRALRKAEAKRVRSADYIIVAREKLERIKRLEKAGWKMGFGCGQGNGAALVGR